MPTVAEIEQAFWSHVWRCDHRWPCKKCCWPWHRSRVARHVVAGAHIAGEACPAHRLAYILAHGALLLPASKGTFVVTHRCDFPPCCNPAHLALGTTGDNLRDAQQKGYFCFARKNVVWFPDGTRLTVNYERRIPDQCRPGWGAYLRSKRRRKEDMESMLEPAPAA